MGALEVAAEEDLSAGASPAPGGLKPRRQLPAWLPLFAALLAPRARPGWTGFVAGFVFFLGHLTWMRPFAFEGWIAGAVICGFDWAIAGLLAALARRRSP